MDAVSTYFTGELTHFYRKVKKNSYIKELDFSTQSVQLLPNWNHHDLKCLTILFLNLLVNYS